MARYNSNLAMLAIAVLFVAPMTAQTAEAGYDEQCAGFQCASIGVGASIVDFSRCSGNIPLPDDVPDALHFCMSYGATGSSWNTFLPVMVTGAGSVSANAGATLPLFCEGLGACSDSANGYAIIDEALFCAVGDFTGHSAFGAAFAWASEGNACS